MSDQSRPFALSPGQDAIIGNTKKNQNENGRPVSRSAPLTHQHKNKMIINLAIKTPYQALYKKSIEQYWVPETVDLSRDKIQWLDIPNDLKAAVLSMLRYAIALDSHQVSNVSNFCSDVQEPDLKALLSVHAFMESVHSASYAYFAETVCTKEEKEFLYEMDTAGMERMDILHKICQNYGEVIANYWLEAVAFQGLFRLADVLRSRQLLPGLSSLIQLINRDENLHIKTFALMMKKDSYNNCAKAFLYYAPIEGKMIAELTGIFDFEQYYPFVAAYYLKALGVKNNQKVEEYYKQGSPFKDLWDLGDHSKKKLKGNFFTTSLVYDNARPDLNWDVNSWFTTEETNA